MFTYKEICRFLQFYFLIYIDYNCFIPLISICSFLMITFSKHRISYILTKCNNNVFCWKQFYAIDMVKIYINVKCFSWHRVLITKYFWCSCQSLIKTFHCSIFYVWYFLCCSIRCFQHWLMNLSLCLRYIVYILNQVTAIFLHISFEVTIFHLWYQVRKMSFTKKILL